MYCIGVAESCFLSSHNVVVFINLLLKKSVVQDKLFWGRGCGWRTKLYSRNLITIDNKGIDYFK